MVVLSRVEHNRKKTNTIKPTSSLETQLFNNFQSIGHTYFDGSCKQS